VVVLRLPQPHTNFVVLGHELDAYWPEARLAVELDVFETHGSCDSFESDRERDAELTAAGIATIRVTDARLDDEPDAVLELRRRPLRRDGVRRRRASRPSRA